MILFNCQFIIYSGTQQDKKDFLLSQAHIFVLHQELFWFMILHQELFDYLIYNIVKITFKNIIRWVKEIKNNCNPSIQVILIGNKKDLNSERKIPYE